MFKELRLIVMALSVAVSMLMVPVAFGTEQPLASLQEIVLDYDLHTPIVDDTALIGPDFRLAGYSPVPVLAPAGFRAYDLYRSYRVPYPRGG